MQRGPVRLALAALALACCAHAPPASLAGEAGRREWKEAMRAVLDRVRGIRRELAAPGHGDPRAAAEAAREAAALFARGYGDLEQREVEGFANLARGAENWILQVGIDARQGLGDLARARFEEGLGAHCVRCHEAARSAGRKVRFEPREIGP